VAEALALTDGDLAEWGSEVRRYPQVLLNVKITERPDLKNHPVVTPVIAEATDALADRGRVLVRYSGTENLARVMVEGEDATEIEAAAQRICAAIEGAIGVG
jgi:phosphoglucosamine mutase